MNFSSKDLIMQNCRKNCNGVLQNKVNPCDNSEVLSDTSEEVSLRKGICNGARGKAMRTTPVVAYKSSNPILGDERFKKWENQILTFGQAFCDNQECNFVGMRVADLESHFASCNGVPNFSLFCCLHCRCGFSNKEDHLKHQQNCNVTIRFDNPVQKRGDSLHFRVIKRMKNVESDEDRIIQPMPDFPKGQYRRRRPYSVQHIKSWVLSLEKYKYVKCIYQNCYFIGMSLEDMISHFGYCNGNGDFAKFVCKYCNGRVTSEAILQKHIARSHPMETNQAINEINAENNHIKVEPQLEDNNDGVLCENMESENSSDEIVKSQEILDKSHELSEVIKMRQSACWSVWKNEIHEFGYAFCRKSLCNFMAPSIPLLEVHLRTCDGTPDFEFLNCPKCRYRLPTREDLERHKSKCEDERMKYYPFPRSAIASSRNDALGGEDDFEVGPVLRKNQGKNFKFYSKQPRANPVSTQEQQLEENINSRADPVDPEESINTTGMTSKNLLSKMNFSQKKRGRPKSTAGEKLEKMNGNSESVKCGKCSNFQGARKAFNEHNLKTHVGLGWIEGETPVDMTDEKLVTRLVKEAFKLSKKAICEKCNDVKRSVLGFISHIQNCGKTEEEKEAIKVPCPYCDGKYLKYSVNAHIKLCRSGPSGIPQKSETSAEELSEPSKKRRSAIKAALKFQQVLVDNDEESDHVRGYVHYEKGDEKLPKLNFKLKNLWYKLINQNEKIPCRFAGCENVSCNVKDAKIHHFNCPLLPDKVFLCQLCDFYSVDEPAAQSHVTTHERNAKHCKVNEDDEEVKLENESDYGDDDDDDGGGGDDNAAAVAADDDDEDDEADGEYDNDEGVYEGELDGRISDAKLEGRSFRSKELKRRKSSYQEGEIKRAKFSTLNVKPDMDIESRLKQNFCRRENLENLQRTQFYINGLDMTLEEELSKAESQEFWPELHTSILDWVQVPLQQTLPSFPELTESISIRFANNDGKWRRFKRFESDLIGGVPVMFTGGGIRSMSWCKVSVTRMLEKTQKQYLAISTARKVDHLRDIHEKSSFQKSTLLQIWDCGALDNSTAQEAPKFSLGIVHDGGEIWDLAWFPEDTYAEGVENRLKRLGLLATASEDGLVRVWSICDPEQLESTDGLRIYKTEPKVLLIADKNTEESCLQLAVGSNGVLAGGFGNGSVSVWNLKNLSSPFCKHSGKSKAIRAHLIIQAHKTAITALTFCPLNNRYFSSAGLDRFVKIWDTEFPSNPVEQYNKEYSLDNIWTLNWPSLIYNYDDVVLNFNKGALKFIRDIVTERHHSTFVMDDMCSSLSFSDWLNALCAGSVTGEVKLSLLKNLVYDQRRPQKTLSSLHLEKLNNCRGKENEGLPDVKIKETNTNKTVPKTYDEVNTGFGLIFRDNLGMDKGKPKKPEVQPEIFPIRALNKVAFNPNFKSFTHIALGYNCGVIRIQALKDLQSTRSVKIFLENPLKKNL